MNKYNQVPSDNNIIYSDNSKIWKSLSHISVPCKDCICLPICKHKYPSALYDECEILRIYEPNFFDYQGRNVPLMKALYAILQPSRWIYEDCDIIRLSCDPLDKPIKSDNITL